MGHNSNVSNFGDAATKPWIDADCFDYVKSLVPQHYKRYTSPSTLFKPKQHAAHRNLPLHLAILPIPHENTNVLLKIRTWITGSAVIYSFLL